MSSVAGLLGNTTAGQADSLFFGNGGRQPGHRGEPNLSYGTWALTVNSSANLQLGRAGLAPPPQITLAGAGNVALGEDAVGNWQKLTTLDASASTGNVTITGHASEDVTNIGNLFLTAGATGRRRHRRGRQQPVWPVRQSAAGLLDGNTAVTVYKLSTGVNFLDVSSDDGKRPGALMTIADAPTPRPTTRSSWPATRLPARRRLDLRRHQGLPGSRRHRLGGTINYANLPSSITRSSTRPPPRAT